MQRTAINPWPWSLEVGYNQAELISAATCQLYCAGQTSVDAQGQPQHLEDMRGQMTLALDNLQTVLEHAEMDLSHITKLNLYSTDIPSTMQHMEVIGARFAALNLAPAMTLLGVTGLALPGLMFEIEAQANA